VKGLKFIAQAMASAVLTTAIQASAQTSIPHTFTEKTPAYASEVNDNFKYLDQKIDDKLAFSKPFTTIGCEDDPLALKNHIAQANPLPGSSLYVAFSGRCEGGIYANDYHLLMYGKGNSVIYSPATPVNSAVGAYYNGRITLADVTVEVNNNTRHGIIAYGGGSVVLSGVSVLQTEEPPTTAFATTLAVFRNGLATLSGDNRLSGRTHGLYIDAGKVYIDSGTLEIDANHRGIYARNHSLLWDRSSNFSISGPEAVLLYNNSVWTREFTPGPLIIEGDINVRNRATFISRNTGTAERVTHASGQFTVDSSNIEINKLVASALHLIRADAVLGLEQDTVEIFATESQVTLSANYDSPTTPNLKLTVLNSNITHDTETALTVCQGFSTVTTSQQLTKTDDATGQCQ
jgi:hypothetical protein